MYSIGKTRSMLYVYYDSLIGSRATIITMLKITGNIYVKRYKNRHL